MSEKKAKVKITPAKGRPMLTWVGKRPLSHVTAFPAQLVEHHDAIHILGMAIDDIETHDERMKVFRSLREHWNAKCWEGQPGVAVPESGGLLFHGDNKDVLANLLANGYRGKVNLVYIDPPFDSGADYVRKVSLRGAKGTARLEGAGYTLGEQIQYTDIWANDNYLQFLYERLLLLKELLADTGTIYVHSDYRRSHFIRCLMEEAFGTEGFVNEVVWQRSNPHNDTQRYGCIHDTLFVFAKGQEHVFNTQYTPPSQEYIDTHFTMMDPDGRRCTLMPMMAQGPGPARKFGEKVLNPPPGTHWRWTQDRIDEAMRKGIIVFTSGGTPRYKYYAGESPGRPLQSLWVDIIPINSQSPERLDYPTQKPEALLERIIEVSSHKGDLVLDCFLGSGTAVAVAQKLGRRWIGCDINRGAIHTTVKRLRGIIAEQIPKALNDKKEKGEKLSGMSDAEADEAPKPCQFGFTVYRVNDYDLQIQHNEAVNLACEHIGVERIRTDPFFDGTLGKGLVKIIPFSHPLTPLDLEEVNRELKARPDEDRNLTLVCLGMELAAQAWIEDWNRLRKGKNAVNRIETIELRTDPKYGKFMKHEPAMARVKITRKRIKGEADRIVVEVQDFISPTIVERLKQQSELLSPKIEDWRAMVDCIMIDTDYKGEVFNVVLADVPEKKSDLVQGMYELPAPEAEATVAVKIVDMLGEEVLIAQPV